MATESVGSGEREKLGGEVDAGQLWTVEVENAPVRVATRRNRADEGSVIRDGDLFFVGVPEGSELWAYGDGGTAADVTLDAVSGTFPQQGGTLYIEPLLRSQLTGTVDTQIVSPVSNPIMGGDPQDGGVRSLIVGPDPEYDLLRSPIVSRLDNNLDEIQGSNYALLTQPAAALSSVGEDSLEVGGSAITATDSGTGSANAAELDLGPSRTKFDVFVDTSASTSLTVEVSPDGTNWRPLDSISYGSAVGKIEQYDTAYQHVRAYADSNLNTLEIASKGA